MGDEIIVQKFWDRDEEAISMAKNRYQGYCLYIARNILLSERDAEECLNDTWLAAWESIPPNRPDNLKTYLGKLMRECAIDCLRRNNAKKRIPEGALVPLDELEEMIGRNGVDDTVGAWELSRIISEFLRTVRESERNVFIRRYWFYDSAKTIGQEYGFTEGKVRMMLKRTRDKLAETLRKEGYLL